MPLSFPNRLLIILSGGLGCSRGSEMSHLGFGKGKPPARYQWGWGLAPALLGAPSCRQHHEEAAGPVGRRRDAPPSQSSMFSRISATGQQVKAACVRLTVAGTGFRCHLVKSRPASPNYRVYNVVEVSKRSRAFPLRRYFQGFLPFPGARLPVGAFAGEGGVAAGQVSIPREEPCG